VLSLRASSWYVHACYRLKICKGWLYIHLTAAHHVCTIHFRFLLFLQAETKCSKLEGDLHTVVTNHRQEVEQLRQQVVQLSAVEHEHSHASNRVAGLSRVNDQLEADLSHARAEIQRLGRLLSEEERKATSLTVSMKSLEERNTWLQTRTEGLKADCDHALSRQRVSDNRSKQLEDEVRLHHSTVSYACIIE